MKGKNSTIHDPRYRLLVENLAGLRKEAGHSQEEIGIALGLSQSDISKIESCERRIDLIELIDFLQVVQPELANELTLLLLNEEN